MIRLEQLRLYLKKLEQFPERRELRRLSDTSFFYLYTYIYIYEYPMFLPTTSLSEEERKKKKKDAYRDEGFSVVEEFQEVGELGFSHP